MQHAAPNLDATFHALGDATRRAVISRLGDGEMAVSALAAPFAMALPSFMQHIAVLEAAGLITSEKRGRSRYCRLQAAPMDDIASWVGAERAAWAARLDRLETYLNAATHKDEKP